MLHQDSSSLGGGDSLECNPAAAAVARADHYSAARPKGVSVRQAASVQARPLCAESKAP